MSPKNRPAEEERRAEREAMVERQIRARGVRDPRVLEAMRQVPRHKFVLPSLQAQAYQDTPLPIGLDQTISQPYMVALMTELLELKGPEKVLEVGTGSGYQAAILAELAEQVYTIERIPELAAAARQRLQELGYHNVTVRVGDGTLGWPEEAPFEAIIVTAGGQTVPPALKEQLAEGGRLVIPVGGYRMQDLLRLRRHGDKYDLENFGPCAFVPLIEGSPADNSFPVQQKAPD